MPSFTERRVVQPRLLDAAFAAVLFLFAGAWSVWFVARGGIAPSYYQLEFSPAVSLACGEGFVARAPGKDTQPLFDFLGGRTPGFDCSSLKGGVVEANLFQRVHPYLIGSVGLLWKLLGFSWQSVLPLYGLLGGLTALATFALLRFSAARPLAALGTVALTLSLVSRIHLPHLRDYSKAPFILGLLALVLWVVTSPPAPRRTAIQCLLAGILLGVGIGFRTDLVIFAPIFIASLVLVAPRGEGRDMTMRLAGSALFVAVLLVTAWPALRAIAGGGNTYHVIALGLMSPFDKPLGITPSIYEIGYFYNDLYVSEIINDFARRSLGSTGFFSLATPAYDRAGLAYLAEVASEFPADVAVRFLAAAVKVLQLLSPEWFIGTHPGLLSSFRPAALAMPWVVLAVLLVMACTRPRLALFGLGLVLFLGGYPSLQFQVRHYFHLQILPLWFLLIAVSWCARIAWPLLRSSSRPATGLRVPQAWAGNVIAGSGFVVVAVSLLLVGPWMLREWQQARLVERFREIERLSVRSVLEGARVEGDRLFIPLRDGSAERAMAPSDLISTYWSAEFESARCGLDMIDLRIQYSASDPFLDASHTTSLVISPRVRYLFPTYSANHAGATDRPLFRRLKGVSIDKAAAACLVDIGEVRPNATIPVLPSIALRENWEREPLYQRIGDQETEPSLRRLPRLVAVPEDDSITREAFQGMLKRLTPARIGDATFLSPSVKAQGGGFRVSDDKWQPYSYQVQLAERALPRETAFIAKGELIGGGITIGLLKDGAWHSQANVTQPGPFEVLLRVLPGSYVVTIANNVPQERHNEFLIEVMGWVDP